MKDNWKTAFWKVWLFALPQAIVELFFERQTKLIKYGKGWTGLHSLITIASAKYMIRAIILILDRFDGENPKRTT
nr:hypothetical protein [Anaerobacillus alkaliphilus]